MDKATDPVIGAAGDISCDPQSSSFNGGLGTATECRQKYTSDLLLDTTVFPDLAAVLPLGDLQYEDGAYTRFVGSYDPSWGRVNAVSRPVPGNHDYGTAGAAGYYQYFGAAAVDYRVVTDQTVRWWDSRPIEAVQGELRVE